MEKEHILNTLPTVSSIFISFKLKTGKQTMNDVWTLHFALLCVWGLGEKDE